ncbi:baseplate wedge subunit [Vibrio phage D81]
MPEITYKGIKIDSLQDIKKRLENAHRAIDPAWPLEPATPDGNKLVVDSETWSNLNEALLATYHALDPDRAPRSALIGIGRISGVTPQDSSPSTAIVSCFGVPGTVIPQGTLVRSIEDGTLWSTNNTITLGKFDTDVGVTCNLHGAITASAGSISEIVDVVGGWSTVTNKAAASAGYNEEQTKDFRIRRRKSVALPAENQMDSLYAKLANTDDVRFVEIYENYESVDDANKLKGHSIAIYVEGGTNENVAKTIASDNNVGTGMNKSNSLPGTKVTKDTFTPKGRPANVTFFRPDHVDVYIDIEMNGGTNKTEDEIRDAIIAYSSGRLIDESIVGFDKTGFKIGENVAPGLLYTPCNKVVGSTGFIKTIKVGKAKGVTSVDELEIKFNELPIFNRNNISVARTAS